MSTTTNNIQSAIDAFLAKGGEIKRVCKSARAYTTAQIDALCRGESIGSWFTVDEDYYSDIRMEDCTPL